MKINIASNEIIHFIGIGGIGMSGLAQIMKNMGFKVQGSDINNNKNIDRLRKFGIKVFIGHNKKNVTSATMVIISSAIRSNNKELISSRKKKYSYCWISWKNYNYIFNIKHISRGRVRSNSHKWRYYQFYSKYSKIRKRRVGSNRVRRIRWKFFKFACDLFCIK